MFQTARTYDSTLNRVAPAAEFVIAHRASQAIIHDLYGIWGDRELTISQHPRIASIRFRLQERPRSLVLTNPKPHEALVHVCDNECCGIRIVDRNIEEPNCLEFGRYRVELWTEDTAIAHFLVDDFQLGGGL